MAGLRGMGAIAGMVLGILGVGLGVGSAIAKDAVGTPPAQKTTQADPQSLLGSWQGRQAGTKNTDLTLVFRPGGKLFMIANRKGEFNAIAMGYRANFQQQPIALDVALGIGEPLLPGIVELKGDQLRWQTATDEKRPTQFDQTASLFTKVPTKPSIPTMEPELEGGWVIGQLTIAQLVHTLDTGKFAPKLSDLQWPTETPNYRYDLQGSPYSADEIRIVARAKRSDLKSFTAGIVRSPESPNRVVIAAICQSFQASRMAPSMPMMAKGKSELVCPPGSVKI